MRLLRTNEAKTANQQPTSQLYLSQARSIRKYEPRVYMGARTRTDFLPYISRIPALSLFSNTSCL